MGTKNEVQTLIGYPALVDRGDHVTLEVMDAADKAQAMHRAGLRRLFMLQLREQARAIEKGLPQAVALQFAAFGDAGELRRQVLAAAFDRACLADPLPGTREAFARRREEARSRVGLIARRNREVPPQPYDRLLRLANGSLK